MFTPQTSSAMDKIIPHVRGLPFFGSRLAIQKDNLKFLTQVVQEYGEIGSFCSGRTRFVILNSPELIHRFLVEKVQDYDKGDIQHSTFRALLGNSLSLSEGEYHRTQRKLLAPIFQPRHLAKYADRIVAYTNKVQETWMEGTTFDLVNEMMKLTLGVFCKVLLDTELQDETNGLNAARNIVWQWINYVATHMFVLSLNVPTPYNLRIKTAITTLKQTIQGMIEERRVNGEDRGDVLSMLLQARYEDGNGMGNDLIRDEIIALFFAAHETGASALSWSFYLLSHHPVIYAKLQQEVDTILAGRLPTYTDLPNLPYTLQVFKEAIRLYPPAARQFRVALRDTELDGYAIPKNTVVMFSQYLLHRWPDSFSNPEEFNPDRFIAENEKNLPRFAYLPFGGGQRICLGNHYALMEGQLILATLVQRIHFELLTKHEIVPKLAVTLHPKEAMIVRVRR